MSRRLSAVLGRLIEAALLPLSSRQRARTRARLIGRLRAAGRRRIETRRGVLLLDASAGAGAASAIARFFEDEPETLAWIEALPEGAVLWDVGANIGLYACYAALDPAVRVVAFEPDPFNFAALAAHTLANRLEGRLIPLALALAAENRAAPLHARTLEAGAAGRALGAPLDHGLPFTPAAVLTVPAWRGADLTALLGLPPPTHLKLDVDGTEADVLAGLGTLLAGLEGALIEVEGENAARPERIETPLAAAGLVPAPLPPGASGRNRLYRRARG